MPLSSIWKEPFLPSGLRSPKMRAASWLCQPRQVRRWVRKMSCFRCVLEKQAVFSLVLPKVMWEFIAKQVLILARYCPNPWPCFLVSVPDWMLV